MSPLPSQTRSGNNGGSDLRASDPTAIRASSFSKCHASPPLRVRWGYLVRLGAFHQARSSPDSLPIANPIEQGGYTGCALQHSEVLGVVCPDTCVFLSLAKRPGCPDALRGEMILIGAPMNEVLTSVTHGCRPGVEMEVAPGRFRFRQRGENVDDGNGYLQFGLVLCSVPRGHMRSRPRGMCVSPATATRH
jgi:hypothetical protein